ncbi:MAG: hypothetical protein LBS26_04905 [Campylobacteraceae bacterium]|jgi:hypothetical protein|nr:hypothetical protein [Campylobacteraceae bacterium]
MKKLLFLILFGLSMCYAIDERQIDFYFGNGVWNTQDQAEISKGELGRLIENNIKTDVPFSIDIVYNWTEGELDDVVETVYQLQQEGQLNIGFFTAVATLYTGTPFSITPTLIAATINSLILARDTQPENLKEMLAKYDASINDGHRVVLISHSQGNLFGVQS